jgi:hypothetical protein
MKYLTFLFLAACSGETFYSIPEGGLPGDDANAESSTDADSGKEPVDSGGLDAREAGDDSSTVDAKPDGPCPTGLAACDDSITVFCARMKACCNGQCMYAWANNGGSQCAMQFNTGTCAGKMVCETMCLADIQSASCTTIKGSPSPPYVASSCWSLWQ